VLDGEVIAHGIVHDVTLCVEPRTLPNHANGAAGPVAPAGPVGATGPQGIQGATGAPGPRGLVKKNTLR
jgi:hypothetical protein